MSGKSLQNGRLFFKTDSSPNREEILAMPHSERVNRVSPSLARRYNLEVIDGAHGTILFIGTTEEREQRTQSFVGALPGGQIAGRRY